MQLVATVISTRSLGYTVEIVTDGTLFIGAFSVRGGGADFIPGTGSRSLAETLRHIEAALCAAAGRDRATELREMMAAMEETWAEGGSEDYPYYNRAVVRQQYAAMRDELATLTGEEV